MTSRWSGTGARSAAGAALLAAAVLAVYGGVADHRFLLNWDDLGYVVKNPAAQGLSREHLRLAFTRTYVGNWAPVHIASYMLDHDLWGAVPGRMALANAVLHAVNALLLAWLVLSLTGRALAAWLAALLFAFHPVQVESVAWISQRKTVLSMAFFLLAFLLFVAYRDGKRPALAYAASLACFALAVLAKSAAVLLPADLVLLDVLVPRRAPRARLVLDKLPFVAVAVAAAGVAVWSQQPIATTARLLYLGGSAVSWTLTMSTVVVRYAGLLAWPADLSAAYAPPFRASLDAASAASLALIAAAGAAAAWLLRRRPGTFLWLGIAVLGLLPVLQIVPLVTLMNDRYLYYPMVGVAPLVTLLAVPEGTAVHRWARPAAAGALVAVAVLLAFLSRSRVEVWRDDLTLWSDAARKTPGAPAVWFSLGASLDDAGRWPEGSLAYLRALSLDLDLPEARLNLGPGRLWDARQGLASGALRSGAPPAEDLVLLGTAHLLFGDRRGAERACSESLRIAPSRPAWVCVGRAWLEPGHAHLARLAFERAAAVDGPVDARLAYLQARAEAIAGEPERALDRLRLALALGYKDFGTLGRDPALAGVRARPGFRDAVGPYLRRRRDRTALPEGLGGP